MNLPPLPQPDTPVSTLEEQITAISHNYSPRVQELTQMVLCDKRFTSYPASLNKHHCRPAGLLAHTLEVIILTLRSLNINPKLNSEALFLGALFHDFGKVLDYRQDPLGSWEKTDHYNKIHHLAASYRIFMEWSGDLDEKLRQDVSHIILSHHGQIEYRAIATPQTKEAWAVHLADMQSVFLIESRPIT